MNTGRNPHDISQPVTDDFSASEIYEVQPSKYLKGVGPQSLLVLEHLGVLRGTAAPGPAELQELRRQNQGVTYLAPAEGREYLLFLGRLNEPVNYPINGIPVNQYYAHGALGGLWLFDISDPAQVVPVVGSQNAAARVITPQTLDELLRQLVTSPAPVTPPAPTPYPGP